MTQILPGPRLVVHTENQVTERSSCCRKKASALTCRCPAFDQHCIYEDVIKEQKQRPAAAHTAGKAPAGYSLRSRLGRCCGVITSTPIQDQGLLPPPTLYPYSAVGRYRARSACIMHATNCRQA